MDDKPIVIVTGASRGVGAAVARWLGKAGAGVVLLARSGDVQNTADDVERLGGSAVVIRGDVADPDTCRNVVEKTIDRFGRLDALVNNAGIFEPMSFIADADTDAWRYNLEVNVFGPFCLARAAIPALRKQAGRIINVSSGASHIPIEAGSAYCVSKAALTHFTRVLAAEEPHLTCISIRPGVVDTAMQAYIRDDGPKIMPADKASYYLDLKEKGQLEPPERPARAIAWLSLHGPHDWSGDFMDYDDPSILEASIAFFGERLDL